MDTKTEWVGFFNGHAPVYNSNSFTQNTLAEVDFLMRELGVSPGASILDVGCGTGRHAVELARRGFVVTGVDVSPGMLEEARKSASAADVHVTWHHADAASFSPGKQFDGVICLCEGAFGLLGSRDHPIGQPLAILRHVAGAMKLDAKCLFTVLNGFALIRRSTQADVEQKKFDPIGLAEVSECSPGQGQTSIRLRERAFVPTDLTLLFGLAGLEILGMWGGTAGNWGKRAIDLDEIEIMVLAQKPADAMRSPDLLFFGR